MYSVFVEFLTMKEFLIGNRMKKHAMLYIYMQNDLPFASRGPLIDK